MYRFNKNINVLVIRGKYRGKNTKNDRKYVVGIQNHAGSAAKFKVVNNKGTVVCSPIVPSVIVL